MDRNLLFSKFRGEVKCTKFEYTAGKLMIFIPALSQTDLSVADVLYHSIVWNVMINKSTERKSHNELIERDSY